MIDRVLNDDRARQAARRARHCYGWLSAAWMALMAAWGLYLIFR